MQVELKYDQRLIKTTVNDGMAMVWELYVANKPFTKMERKIMLQVYLQKLVNHRIKQGLNNKEFLIQLFYVFTMNIQLAGFEAGIKHGLKKDN